MARFPSYFMDEGKRWSEDVRWALESFNFVIKDYFEDTFRKFHDDLYNNVVQTRGVCCQKCSKHKPVEDWCSLCSEWRNGILAKHAFRSTVKVNWKNIDSSKLPSDIKEVQKVFLPNWYKGKLDSSDLSLCLNIMTNCTLFESRQKLLQIRMIRNEVSHGSCLFTETEKRNSLGKILSCLKTDELKSYQLAQEAINHVQILKNHSLKDIYEQNLMDELERNRIEKRLYGKTCQINLYICVILIAAIVALMAVIYAWNQNKDNEELEDPSIPDKPSFFFTSHDEFLGRDWLKKKIRISLNQSKSGVILVAEPGFGKSAFVANLIKTYNNQDNIPLLGYHVCQHDLRSSLDVSNFIMNLLRDLKKRYANFVDAVPSTLKGNDEIKKICTFDPLQCFQELIVNPLKSSNLSDRSLFVLDAIDECKHPSLGTEKLPISELLLKQYMYFKPIVSIFMTSRNNIDLISRFRQLKQMHIEPNNEENKNDLREFVQHKTECPRSAVNRLVEEAKGNFLILKNILSDMQDECRYVFKEKINTIFQMYDSRFLRLYGDDFARKFRVDRAFFEVLCSQFIEEPMTVNTMKEILKFSFPSPYDDEFEEMMHRVQTNVIRVLDNHEIHFPHSSLFYWLTSSNENVKFSVNVHRGHYLWTSYLYKKLEIESSRISLSFNHSSINHLYSLAGHFIHSKNKSLQNDLESGKFKLSDIRITCVMCWRKAASRVSLEDGTMSHIEYAILNFFNFDMIKTLILLSRSNLGKEAHTSFSIYHIDAFNALIESGRVDVKEKQPTVDNWMSFGISCLPAIQDDMLNEEIIDGENLTRKQLILNAVGNISIEYINLFHLMVGKGDICRINTFASQDKSLMDEKTGNGWDVFDIAVSFNNLIVFQELRSIKPVEISTWHLWYASLHASISLLDYVLRYGIRDECGKCKQKKFDEHFEINADILKDSKKFENSISVSQALKYRKIFLCESALMVAVKRGNDEVVRKLLLYGTQCLEYKDAFGFTPLAAAIYFRHDSIVKLLLKNGANENFVVKTLMNSADVEVFNTFLRFPLEKKWNSKNVLNGATIYHLISLKPTCFTSQLLRKLLQKGTKSADIKDDNGHSPLYYAVCHPEADNDYESLNDYLQPKSHRIAFVLIEAYHSKIVSDSLLIQLGICCTKKQYHSELIVKSRHREKFCTVKRNFPETKDFILTSEPGLIEKYLDAAGMHIPHLTYVASEESKSSHGAIFFYRQFPQSPFNSKGRIRIANELSEKSNFLYLRGMKPIAIRPSVSFT